MNRRIVTAVVLLFSVPASASARPMLDHASPAAGSIIRKAPSQIALSFNQALLPSGSDAVVRNANGGVVSSGKSRLDNKTQLQVPIESLPSGKYRVEWFATAADKSHSQGSFTFIVGEENAARASARKPARHKQ